MHLNITEKVEVMNPVWRGSAIVLFDVLAPRSHLYLTWIARIQPHSPFNRCKDGPPKNAYYTIISIIESVLQCHQP